MFIAYLGQCSLPLNTSDISSTSASLSWSRRASASGNVYTVEITAGAMVESVTVTDGGQTVSHTLSDLRPFTSYTVEVSMGSEHCGTTFTTLEGGKCKVHAIIVCFVITSSNISSI